MKRFLILLLAVLMLIPSTVICVSADETDNDQVKEGTVPKSFSLIGTPDLPPIVNQGEVGCCASCAITYTQYTNAVSKYIRKNHPEIKFEPASGELQYLFAPKWTFGFSGSGTAWVYHILMEQGAVTMDKSSFLLHPKSKAFFVHGFTGLKKFSATAIAWDITEQQMEEAMKYRLASYEQIWVGGNHALGKVDGKLELTTTEDGKALLNKVKEALNAGNVVVTGGLSAAWQYSSNKDPDTGKSLGKIVDTGTLGKKTDHAMIYSRGDLAGGHQLSIVGYDDEIAFEVNGVTLKGAFQVSNSWGEDWMNDGYVWLMYDALNERSEFEELNFENRVITMDQFCFTDWEKDIIEGLPELYVEAEVSTKNRESINLVPLTRNNETHKTESTSLYMFSYTNYHPDYDELGAGDYFAIDGEKNGDEAKGTFSVGYNSLIADEAKIGDYTYGIRVQARKGEVTVHALRLKNNRGEVIAEIEIPEGGEKVSVTKNYYFDQKVFKVTLDEAQKQQGVDFEAFSAYYCEGNTVAVDVTPSGDAENIEVIGKTDTGKALTKNDKGQLELTVSENAVISLETKEAEPVVPSSPEEPSVSEESNAPVVSPSEDENPSDEKKPSAEKPDNNGNDSDGGNSGAVVIIIIVSVVAVAVIGVVVVVFVKKHK